jgi:hypothetical protein
VPRLVLHDDLVAYRLQTGVPEERWIRLAAKRSKEHGCAQPVDGYLLPGVSRAERAEEEAAAAEPEADASDQAGLLLDRDVPENEQRTTASKRPARSRARPSRERSSPRDMMPRELDLAAEMSLP